MTPDQLIRLIEAFTWPAAFIIVGWTAVKHLKDAVTYVTDHLSRRISRLVLTIITIGQALLKPRIAAESTRSRIEQSSEKVMELIIAHNGGFPEPPPGDSVGRAIVREVRSMYAEIENPTRPPARPVTQIDPHDFSYVLDEEDVAQIYSEDPDAES